MSLRAAGAAMSGSQPAARELGTNAQALSAAASARGAKAASDALGRIKSTCKSCHTKFR